MEKKNMNPNFRASNSLVNTLTSVGNQLEVAKYLDELHSFITEQSIQLLEERTRGANCAVIPFTENFNLSLRLITDLKNYCQRCQDYLTGSADEIGLPWSEDEIKKESLIEETLKDFHFNIINLVASVENCHRLERYKFTEGVQMGLLCMHRVQGWIMAFRESESLQLAN